MGTVRIGPYELVNNVFAAPMAGVTDRPYRRLARAFGAGYVVCEMAASNPRLWASVKTARRLNHDGEPAPRAVQLAGGEPAMMAEAARFNAQRGAQVIDINMGCPAKKVCNVSAGSALMADAARALAIVEAVVGALREWSVPVTVKMRTGPSPHQRNAVALAQRFEAAGVAALTIHGRSRACGFQGSAEYDTIAQVKAAVSIPVIANGDIDSPLKAAEVLRHTGADAVMIGRAALGRPWLFGQVAHFLVRGELLAPPSRDELYRAMRAHLLEHYAFYGEATGVRTARKHVGWYFADQPAAAALIALFNRSESATEQIDALDAFFARAPADPPPLRYAA